MSTCGAPRGACVFNLNNFLLIQKGENYRLLTQVVPGHRRIMWVIESNFQDYIQDAVSCSGASVMVHPSDKTCEEYKLLIGQDFLTLILDERLRNSDKTGN